MSEQITRLNEVLEHQTIMKNINLSDKKIQTQYLADINVSLALIFDELRMLRTHGIMIEDSTVPPFIPVVTEEHTDSPAD